MTKTEMKKASLINFIKSKMESEKVKEIKKLIRYLADTYGTSKCLGKPNRELFADILTLINELEEENEGLREENYIIKGNPPIIADRSIGKTIADEVYEALYNAGYRKVPEYAVIIPSEEREEEIKATNEILAERDGLKAEIERLKAVLEIKQKQAVKEFAERVKEYINNKVIADFDDSDSVKYYTIDLDEFESEIDELLKEYEK